MKQSVLEVNILMRTLKMGFVVTLVIICLYAAVPKRVRAQVNTFATTNLPQAWTAIQNFNSGITTPSVNRMIYVDGLNYTTLQAAVTAACSDGGVVLVPQGTYVGPTTFCSNLTIKPFNYGYFGTPTKFTYTAPLVISNLHNLDIEGVQFNMGASGGVSLSSVSASRIDVEIVTTQTTTPALLLTCTVGGGNTAYNQFMRLVTNGGSEGIKWSGLGGPTPTCAVTENQFGMLQAYAPSSAPSSTWTAFDVVQDSDSNVVQQSHMYNLSGPLAAANGWVFNSSSLTTNNGTSSWKIEFFDDTSRAINGCGVTVNQSSGITITAGVLSWSGRNQMCLGPGATPMIDFMALNSNNDSYLSNPIVWGSAEPQLLFSSGHNSGVFASLQPSAGFTNGTNWKLPPTSGTVALATVEYCGATSGRTQACAKTVENLPLIIFGDVTLNGASTQSITSLPFTGAATYSCSGSDLTDRIGIVSFNNYAKASVTIAESGGGTSDHLRYMCSGY
jgi:hypothetical protein